MTFQLDSQKLKSRDRCTRFCYEKFIVINICVHSVLLLVVSFTASCFFKAFLVSINDFEG
ncbi:CLUMA_CG008823, isoform A [Clunio marinus]|uniref:CLUMA_CG008823, isoform A n=1 Tax=Clunio marinus TaxID=568069 RepID=A0A1J1I4F9_9DIPT|nr:CLUMA_CG008823, isoform A [Clunio marinus]